MGKPSFSDEFKRDAVAQITERGYPGVEVSQRLGVSLHSLCAWKRQFAQRPEDDERGADIKRLKRDLTRVTEERDSLERPPRISPRMQSEMRVHGRASIAVLGACDVSLLGGPAQRVLCLAEDPAEQPSAGRRPSDRVDPAGMARQRKVCGYRKLHDDLLDHGETCCPHRLARLTRLAGIKAHIGYKRRPGSYG